MMVTWSLTDGRPFLTVHHLPDMKETGVPYLMPGVPVTCKVDNTEKYTTRSKVTLVMKTTVTSTESFHLIVVSKVPAGPTQT